MLGEARFLNRMILSCDYTCVTCNSLLIVAADPDAWRFLAFNNLSPIVEG